jgi:hypothetical protein
MALADYALCVGINSYPGGLTALTGAEVDAKAFYDWVTGSGGVAKANAKLLLSSGFPKPAALADAQPADREIWRFIEDMRAAAKINNDNNLGSTAGRRLYLFFSGHGFSPSLDTSGVLMANAERQALHNLSPKAWADRFYENGLFEEVLLFQDACREQVNDVELTPPYLKKSVMPGIGNRKRFYAFAAKSPLLAIERPIGGVVRGVFSATLMAGLEGGARDPMTGEITGFQLKSYLVANMVARLEPADLDNDDISKRPEVFDLDPFVIVPAAPVAAASDLFPVAVASGVPGARILDGARAVVATAPIGPPPWRVQLPVGLFELVVPGQPSFLFKVSGALGPNGQPEVVEVGHVA